MTQTGWYPDPSDGTRLRYWDGEAWTSQVRGERPAGVPPPPQSVAANPPDNEPSKRVGLLRAVLESLVVFLVGAFLIGGFLVNILLSMLFGPSEAVSVITGLVPFLVLILWWTTRLRTKVLAR